MDNFNLQISHQKKEKINWLIDYLKTQMEKLGGVEIRYNTPATVEVLKELDPYAVFVAQGAVPIVPKSIPGIDGEKVLTCADVLSGKANLQGKKVAVVGSGMTGIETAHLLAADKNHVSIFEMEDQIGPGVYFQNLIDVMKHMEALEVEMYPKHKLIEIDGSTAIFENTQTNKRANYDFDYIIISLGTRSNIELIDEIKDNFERVEILGGMLIRLEELEMLWKWDLKLHINYNIRRYRDGKICTVMPYNIWRRKHQFTR